MNARTLGRIEEYSRNTNSLNELGPVVKDKLSTIVDSFQYADEDDLALLRRVVRRIRIEPKVASALCALCVGYEELVEGNGMNTQQKNAFDDVIVDTVRASAAASRTRSRSVSESENQFDTIRNSIMEPGEMDQELLDLNNLADLTADECVQNGNRWLGYKCDIRPTPGSNRCGLTTAMGCRKGASTGHRYCENVPGTNRCRLSDHGKTSKDRKEIKRQIDARFQDARRAYVGR